MGARLPLYKYTLAVIGPALAVAALVAIRENVNLTTVGLLLVLAVMMAAIWGGRGPALAAALVTAMSFNYYFIPPLHTFRIHGTQDWIAFFVFIAVALAVGELSSQEKARAEQAESRRLKIEELYRELQQAFEQASEAETLRRSEKLKTALLDAVTHDLRTPLTSIKASATTLLDDTMLSESSRELLQVINEESDRLNRFVEEMMALAQIEGGHLLLNPRPTDADDIVSNALERAATALDGTAVEITLEHKLPMLMVDAATVSQVLYEIVENASRYTPKGGSIHVTGKRAGPAQVEIAVANDGPAVPEQVRTRVFEKFFRGPDSSKHGGFGMGLAIARGIVEAHGGHIWMEAGPRGRGTVVRFTVPSKAE